MVHVMTNAQYVEKSGIHCPFCHESKGVDATGPIEVLDFGAAIQPCKCHTCGKAWDDNYSLVGFEKQEESS